MQGTHEGWGPRDWVSFAVVTAVAVATRAFGLGSPARQYFDESFYAVDGCFYVLSPAKCGADHATEFTTMHPPVGKWLIGLGIDLFGNDAGGWRIMPAMAGIATVALVFLLGRSLSGRWVVGALAGLLLALDPLHIVQSRVAMLDVFLVLFLVGAAVCWERDRHWVGVRPIARPWRLAAGACLGLAMATKWTAAGACVVIVLLTVVTAARARRSWRQLVRREGVGLVVAFVVVPALVYTATFIGRVHGDVLAAPWDAHSWIRTFIGRQRGMMHAHLQLGHRPHPFASPAWSWPFVKRPIPYFFERTDDGRIREILAAGNLVTWWAGLVALGAATVALLRRRASDLELVAVALFAGVFLPMLLVEIQRSFIFVYYFVPALPFLYLALAGAVGQLAGGWHRVAGTAVIGGGVAWFAFFFPVLYARPLSYESWRDRILFTDCDGVVDVVDIDSEPRSVPTLEAVDPPSGWCWL